MSYAWSSDPLPDCELLGWEWCLLAVCPWASDSTSLRLNCLICKTGLKIPLVPGGSPVWQPGHGRRSLKGWDGG